MRFQFVKNAVQQVKNTRICFVLPFSHDAEKSTSHGNSFIIRSRCKG